MRISKLLALALLALQTSSAAAQFVPPGIAPSETVKIADGLYSFRWGAYRSLFLVTDAGVIATDPLSPEAASAYRKAIAAITPLPVKYVVYSHSHWDHARGGKIFKAEGAQFIAQQRCKTNMQESPDPDIVMPDITFDRHYSVKLGQHTLDLYYFGPSHDTCLTVMIPRPHKMLYAVDLVTPRPAGGGYLPWDPQVADFHFHNAVTSLRAIEDLATKEGLTTVIGAHLVPLPQGKGQFGAADPVGPINTVRERREFWEGIMAAVKSEMDNGTESFMVSSRLDLSPWQNIRGFNKRKFKQLIDRIAAYYAIGR
jgi:glyoxylase-like metal-dependent hydrolase (beta-lactamase superfamily II)